MSERPQLNIDTSLSKPTEAFLHNSLRPILKQKNERFVALLLLNFHDKKIDISTFTFLEIKNIIDTTLQKDIAFKQLLLGVVISELTQDEFNFYAKNKKELNKRIFALLKERFISQIEIISSNKK